MTTIVLEDAACPRCGARDAVPVHRCRDVLYGVPGEYQASSCRRCGLWFQNPRPTADSLAELYPPHYRPHTMPETPEIAVRAPTRRGRLVRRVRAVRAAWMRGYVVYGLGYRGLQSARRLRRAIDRLSAAVSSAARRQADRDLVPRFRPGGRLLELGAGTGERLSQLRDLGWGDVRGVELSVSAAAAARARGLDVATGQIEDALAAVPDGHFDVIVASMVLEHLLDPFAVVGAIARTLKPGGELLFSTVVRDSFDGWIFGPYGVSYDFPRHMVFFRRRDLETLVARDFDDVSIAHHATPLDFWRPARLRNRAIDRWILRFFRVPGTSLLVAALARLGLTGRVSFRCRRKAS